MPSTTSQLSRIEALGGPVVSYDHWKTTNHADEWLGPPPDEADVYVPCPCCFESSGYVWQHGNDWESGPWSVQTNVPCRECNGTGSLWVEASYPECAEELAEYFADDPGAEPDPLNLETA